jgi:hypothetical protein
MAETNPTAAASATAHAIPGEALAKSWESAEQAVQNICGGKGNFNHLWQLVRSLCELGLAGLAEPVLATIKIDSPSWLAQRDAVLEQARKLPDGKLTWQSRERIFENNIAALSAANPQLSTLRDFWRTHRDRFALFCAGDGNYQVVDWQSPVIFAGFVGGLSDHRALTRFWTYECKGYQLPRAVAFDGAGYGWVLQRVLETTHRTLHNYSCAIYIVEPDLLSACILLNLHDLTPWKDRVRLFAGPDAQRQFEEGLKRNLNWDVPGNMVSERIAERAPIDLQASATAIGQIRLRADTMRSMQLGAHYAAVSIDDWAAKFEAAVDGKKPLKVVGMTSRYTTVLQYSMDELGAAITAAGHEFILCKEPDDQCANVHELQLIHEHKPDLMVMISRLRYENPRLPKDVPCLTWDQDNLPCMRSEEAKKSLDAVTYIAGLGARLGYEQLEWPRENCILSFAAAATHRYHNAKADEALLNKHRCTFSYTSNASATPESAVAEYRQSYTSDAKTLALFDRVCNEILTRARTGLAWDTATVQKLVDAAVEADRLPRSEIVRREMVLHLRSISDKAFRHVALGWVVDFCRAKDKTLRLYGMGWEKHPQFAPYAAGFVAPGEEMRAVYQASDINLQIIETGFMHSRVLDGLAAGGFFLYRFAPEARDLDGTEKARLIMTRRAIDTGCVTYGQLEASTDPLIAGSWAHQRPLIHIGPANERCRWIDIWAAAPSEETQFSDLNEITFSSQQQFNVLADHFLADEKSRADVASRLRQVVVDRFSYDARWRSFLAGITAGLRGAAQKQAIVSRAA